MNESNASPSRTLDIKTIELYGRALIEASAGTGKTYTIANLVLRLLLEPRIPKVSELDCQAGERHRLSIDQILIVTFTNAATEELRGRVRLRIKQAHVFLQRYELAAKVYQDSDYKCQQDESSVHITTTQIKQAQINQSNESENYIDPAQESMAQSDHDAEFEFCCEAIQEHDVLMLAILKPYTKDVDSLSSAKTALKDALLQMDEAAIYTIHGFCQRVLQQHAFESGSYFDLNLVQDPSEELLEVATAIWREQCYGKNLSLSYFLQQNYKDPSGLLYELRPLIGKSGNIIPKFNIGSKLSKHSGWEALAEKIEQNYQKAQTIWLHQSSDIKALLSEHKALNRNQYRLTSLPKRYAELDDYFADHQQTYALPKSFEYFTREKVLGASKKDPLEHLLFDYCEKIQDLVYEFEIHFIQEMSVEFEHRFEVLKQERRQLGFDDLLAYLDQALKQDDSGEFAKALGQQYPVAMIDEFQDTDPTQYAIFDTVYHDPSLTLFMIGDPKQAIYSFRGADIHTYLKAKQQVGSSCYTLDVNYRSIGAVVNSVNHLFLQSSQPFGADNLIDYPCVSANQHSESGLVLSGEAKSGLSFGYMNADDYDELEIDKKSGLIIKDSAAKFAAKACATEVVRLLHDADQGRANIAGKPISAEDIAILVRDKNEAALIQSELKQRRVGSVFISRDSVFHTLEAMQLRMVLSACHNPSSGALLRGVLGSTLFGFTANQLNEMADNGSQWESHVLNFWRYSQAWKSSGFMAMWSHVMQDYGLAEKVIALDDGERRLTNLLQLAELLQKASQKTHGEQGLLAWFDEQLNQEQQDIEEQQLRLESDSTLVQVTTIHKSKGLEYPIVFLPFAFKTQKPKMQSYVTFYDKSRESYLIDIGSEDKKSHHEQAIQDRLSEDLRLYYVALTRPRYLCRIYWGLVKEVEHTALYHLLYSDVKIKEQTPEQFKARLAGIVNQAGTLDVNLPVGNNLPADDNKNVKNKSTFKVTTQDVALLALNDLQINNLAYDPDLLTGNQAGRQSKNLIGDGVQLQSKVLTRPIDRSWRMTSYSGLINNAHSPLESPDHDESSANDSIQGLDLLSVSPEVLSLEGVPSIFTFEKGKQAGNFMHKVLEDAGFESLANREADELIGEKLIAYGFDAELWQEVIAEHFQTMMSCPLNEKTNLALGQISPQHCLDELEFYLPMTLISTPALNRVFNQYRKSIDVTAPSLTLQFNDMKGMLKGFIDLVFEHQGQFFVADYKSNHLGDGPSQYHFQAMQLQMFDHKYDIQLLIYTLALHRYLQSRLAHYDYDQHIGGAYYLFIRGMSGQCNELDSSSLGVYYFKPPFEDVLALESILLSPALAGVEEVTYERK